VLCPFRGNFGVSGHSPTTLIEPNSGAEGRRRKKQATREHTPVYVRLGWLLGLSVKARSKFARDVVGVTTEDVTVDLISVREFQISALFVTPCLEAM
jgi:hypothetical protein